MFSKMFFKKRPILFGVLLSVHRAGCALTEEEIQTRYTTEHPFISYFINHYIAIEELLVLGYLKKEITRFIDEALDEDVYVFIISREGLGLIEEFRKKENKKVTPSFSKSSF